MKIVIITVPMMKPEKVRSVNYPVDGNTAIEYGKPVLSPISGVLAKTLKKDEELKIIYIMTKSKNSKCEENKRTFKAEIEGINAEIGAVLSFDAVEIDFEATKRAYNKLITDLADKIPDNADIFVDYTYGSKPEILSLFCALRFVEEFRDANVEYIIYGKVEFNEDAPGGIEYPMLYDTTPLYYLFKLMGTIGSADAETASKILNEFFSL